MRMVINFGSLLSQFRIHQSSQVLDDTLSKPEVTVEEILDIEDEAVSETKNKNAKLLEFLSSERLLIMLQYISIEPSPAQSQKVCFKFPFVAAEILSCDNGDLLDRFFADTRLLDCLFKLLNKNTVNSTLAGYFAKVVGALLRRNSYELLSYIYEQNSHGDLMVKHIYSRAIADLLEVLLGCEDHLNPAFKDKFLRMLQLIVNAMEPDAQPEAIKNTGYLLTSVVQKHGMNNWQEILSFLHAPETVNQLCGMLFTADMVLLREVSGLLSVMTSSDFSGESPIVTVVGDNLDKIIDILKRSQNDKSVSTWKVPFVPIEEQRIRVIDLLSTCLKTNSSKFFIKLADTTLVDVVTVSY